MSELVLVTGGAGFIGRHVGDALLRAGHRVRVLDSLIEQVHGPNAFRGAERPDGLDPEIELQRGDVRDRAAVDRALQGVDSVIHLAAEVGVGQSMYAVERYTSVNDVGTAVLFEGLIARPVRRVVVASSMSIYGEGLYRDQDGNLVEDAVKPAAGGDLNWDPADAKGRPLHPVPTPETKRPALASVYAIGKYLQERYTLTLSAAYGMESCALRLWNAYGPGQALGNPYTGVLAIFSSRLLNGQPPVIFEDGRQQRDFVHVRDVARAFVDALYKPQADGGVFNIGSGQVRTVREVAAAVGEAMGKAIPPQVTGKARVGDIRHCIPDLGLAHDRLGYRPQEDWMAGLTELAEWTARQTAADRVETARAELEARGLVA